MSPSSAELLRQVKIADRRGRSVRGQRADRRGRRADRRARDRRVRHGPSARGQARAPELPGDADRGRRARPRRARDPLLRLRQSLGLRGAHARTGPRLHERLLDDRRDHAVEGPRLRGHHAAHAHPRAARALLAATSSSPRSAPRASRSSSTPRSCCSAPAASARPPRSTWPPPASARSGSSTTTSSTSPTCSAR